jgi:hypothetical protein
MAIVVSAKDAPAITQWLNERLPGTQVVGTVNASGVVTHLLPTVRFNKY